jgi:hypothetical protein
VHSAGGEGEAAVGSEDEMEGDAAHHNHLTHLTSDACAVFADACMSAAPKRKAGGKK